MALARRCPSDGKRAKIHELTPRVGWSIIRGVLLAVDLGNTNITYGIFREAALERTFRTQTVRSRTADEYAVLLRQLLDFHGIRPGALHAAILASVVPQLTEVLTQAIELVFGTSPLVVGPGMKTGIPVLYDNPHDVGADRVVNAVAAYERVRGPAIVVDFGTATTFDCISPKGEYLGGIIVPGIHVSLDGLMERAAKLRPIELAEPPRVVGKNTAHSLQSGVVFGYAAMLDGLVDKIQRELGYQCYVIGTGGLAALLAKQSVALQSIDPDLTLHGLRILFDRNHPETQRRKSPER